MISFSTQRLGKYDVYSGNLSDLLEYINERVEKDITTSIVTINPEIFLHASKSEQHEKAIEKANIVVPDGVGIVWALKYLAEKSDCKSVKFLRSLFAKNHGIIQQRITGVDLSLLLAEKLNLPIKIFGSRSGEQAKQQLNKTLPRADIDVYDQVEVGNDGVIDEQAKQFLTNKKSLIFVALGAPKQELVMNAIYNNLMPGSVIMGVGGTIDFISGHAKRAPKFMRQLGLEWLFRLITEPKRFKRIINAVIVFPYKFIKKY